MRGYLCFTASQCPGKGPPQLNICTSTRLITHNTPAQPLPRLSPPECSQKGRWKYCYSLLGFLTSFSLIVFSPNQFLVLLRYKIKSQRMAKLRDSYDFFFFFANHKTFLFFLRQMLIYFLSLCLIFFFYVLVLLSTFVIYSVYSFNSHNSIDLKTENN